jgi:DUF1680 family protein
VIDHAAVTDRGYARISRRGQTGDEVSLVLDMPPQRIYANPEVRANFGRVALKRGPILYCLEAADNTVPVHRVALPREAAIDAEFDAGLLGGAGTLTTRAVAIRFKDETALYSSDPPQADPAVPIRAIPYHLWDHREAGEMCVWLQEL